MKIIMLLLTIIATGSARGSHLPELNADVILQITQHLDESDLKNLHTTCKYFKEWANIARSQRSMSLRLWAPIESAGCCFFLGRAQMTRDEMIRIGRPVILNSAGTYRIIANPAAPQNSENYCIELVCEELIEILRKVPAHNWDTMQILPVSEPSSHYLEVRSVPSVLSGLSHELIETLVNYGILHLTVRNPMCKDAIEGLETCEQQMALIWELVNLRSLDLYRFTMLSPGFNFIGNLTSLESLNLGRAGFSSAEMPCLRGLIYLQDLNLEGAPINDDDIEQLRGCTSLQRLNLCGIRAITGVGLIEACEAKAKSGFGDAPIPYKGLATLVHLPNLREVNLACSGIVAEKIDLLRSLFAGRDVNII